MQLLVNRTTIANLPLIIVFVLYPIISAVFTILGINTINYELLNAVILLFFITIGIYNNTHVDRRLLTIIILIIYIIFFKYILPVFYEINVVWRAIFIDIKWLIYLLLALLWIVFWGKIDFNKLYYYGKIYAVIYICYVVIKTIITGEYDRANSGLLSECNYDCYLMLIPFCFYYNKSRKILEFILFLSAVLISTSKTGFITFFAIICYRRFSNSRFKLPILIVFIGLIAVWLYIYFIKNGVTDAKDVDRVVYYVQCFDYLKQTSLSNLIFGIFPGKAMEIDPIPSFEWTIQKFEDLNNISGCYPFIFHSTYIRLGITWGIPTIITIIISLLYLFFKTKSDTLKYLLIVFFLESISLSTLSLVSISYIYMVTLISAILCRNNQKSIT